MSSVQHLREFVNERLSAAAEEIFGVLKQTIVEYEEEIDRQRRLLDIVWKPEIKLHRIDLPRQRVYIEEVLTDQQCIQERNSCLDQEDPEPPQIKEEQEELCTSQEGEQSVLKEETKTLMLTPPDEDTDHSEQEQNYDHEYLVQNSHVGDQERVMHEDSGSTRDAESEPKNRHGKERIHNNNIYNSTISEIHCNTLTGKKTFKCDFCGKYFKRNSTLHIHLRIHTGEKPYTCETCGNAFRTNDHLIVHMRRSHTGEKPYTCKTCGRSFTSSSELISHTRTHTGEKPYSCMTCRKDYREISALKKHLRIHTGEKPYTCKTCGKAFRLNSALKIHVRIHTGEKPHICKICGDAFRQRSNLAVHLRRAHAEFPQQKVPTDQQLCIQERNFTVDQEDSEPPHFEEELCTVQSGGRAAYSEGGGQWS